MTRAVVLYGAMAGAAILLGLLIGGAVGSVAWGLGRLIGGLL